MVAREVLHTSICFPFLGGGGELKAYHSLKLMYVNDELFKSPTATQKHRAPHGIKETIQKGANTTREQMPSSPMHKKQEK